MNTYLDSLSGATRDLRDQVLSIVGDSHHHSMAHTGSEMHTFQINKDKLQRKLDYVFSIAASHSTDLIRRMRVSTYTLASAGESEAIARTLGKPVATRVDQDTLIQAMAKDSPSGGKLRDKIEFFFNRIKHKVFVAMEHAVVLDDTVEEARARVEQVFPKAYRVKRPARELKAIKFKEADAPDWLKQARQDYAVDFMPNLGPQDIALTDSTSLAVGVIDDGAWSQVVDDYKREYVPFGRGTQDFTRDELGSERFDWEIEKEATQDFVDQVRAGQVQAAKENGINDFMWIAVIDDKTDECCAWRDGLTTSEIEEQLKSGAHEDDACDGAITPPGHFNCRCALAPVTADMPEATPPDFGEFETWMNG